VCGISWDGGDCCNVDTPLFNCRDPLSSNFGALINLFDRNITTTTLYIVQMIKIASAFSESEMLSVSTT
jgi:hypothetical protein